MIQSYKLYDQDTLYPQIIVELNTARGRFVFYVPYLTPHRAKYLSAAIAAATKRGVEVCCFLQEPPNWKQRELYPQLKIFETAMAILEQAGAHITLRAKLHEKMLFVDSHIFYDGSFNVLSQYDSSERMTRFESFEMVRDNAAKYKINECSKCFGLSPSDSGKLLAVLGKTATDLRKQFGLTQRQLAENSGLPQRYISEIERGKRDVRVATAEKVMSALDVELIAVPRYLVPAVQKLLTARMAPPL